MLTSPMTPAELRAYMAERAQAHVNEIFPFGRVGTMRATMELMLGGRDQRHLLTTALFGEPSLSRLTNAELWALWDWMDSRPVDGQRQWAIRVHWQSEALAVLAEYRANERQAQSDAGQLGLL